MASYAVVQTGGKQYRVEEGNVFNVELLDAEVGKKVKLDEVLALNAGEELVIGTPTVSGASVTAEVVEHLRGDKVIAFKKKRRKGYKRKVGHRQELTRIRIDAIGKTAAKKKAAPKKAETVETPAETQDEKGA